MTTSIQIVMPPEAVRDFRDVSLGSWFLWKNALFFKHHQTAAFDVKSAESLDFEPATPVGLVHVAIRAYLNKGVLPEEGD